LKKDGPLNIQLNFVRPNTAAQIAEAQKVNKKELAKAFEIEKVGRGEERGSGNRRKDRRE
jgi:hypothetical protein